MSRKKHKHHEEHIDETWLIPYADLLTLLLALFIVLFAMSSVDAVKFKQMAESFKSTFNGGTGVMKYPSPLPPKQMESVNKEDAKNKASNEEKQLEQLKEKMDTYIESKDLNVEVKTTLTDEGLMLTLRNDILFDSGTANVRLKDYQLARDVSQLLVMDTPREIIISGHTDNIPIHNSNFDSNWHLSVMRAISFMKILLENNNLDSKMFSAKGFGEFKPVASNDTPEGRMANRRVEILIKPNTTKINE